MGGHFLDLFVVAALLQCPSQRANRLEWSAWDFPEKSWPNWLGTPYFFCYILTEHYCSVTNPKIKGVLGRKSCECLAIYRHVSPINSQPISFLCLVLERMPFQLYSVLLTHRRDFRFLVWVDYIYSILTACQRLCSLVDGIGEKVHCQVNTQSVACQMKHCCYCHQPLISDINIKKPQALNCSHTTFSGIIVWSIFFLVAFDALLAIFIVHQVHMFCQKNRFIFFNDTIFKTLCRNKPSKTTRPLRPTTESSFAATTGSFDPFNTPAPPTTPSSAPGRQLFPSTAEFSF